MNESVISVNCCATANMWNQTSPNIYRRSVLEAAFSVPVRIITGLHVGISYTVNAVTFISFFTTEQNATSNPAMYRHSRSNCNVVIVAIRLQGLHRLPVVNGQTFITYCSLGLRHPLSKNVPYPRNFGRWAAAPFPSSRLLCCMYGYFFTAYVGC
jgi:hypothetical protein